MENGQFVRVLTRRDVLAISFGAMVGWSWVVLSGQWVLSAGTLGAILAFTLGGIAVIVIGLTYAELASAMPQAGGEHVYSHRALGGGGAFVCTWAIILGYVSVAAFEAVALPTVVSYIVPNLDRGYLWTVAGWDVTLSWALIGVVGAIFMTWLNILGIKPAAFFQTVATVAIVLVGFFFISGSFVVGEVANFEPLFEDGAKGVLAVLVMVPFMFVGFDVIPQSAEEIDLPFAQIGKVLVVSVCLAALWYIFVILGVSLALDNEQMAAADLVTADAASAVYQGRWAGTLLVVGGLAGILTSWNAFIVGGSRAIYAMAKSGMLPGALARLHPKYNTPRNAILLIGVLSCIAPLFGRPALVWLVDAGGLAIVVAYALVALSFLVLRKREPEMARPYKIAQGKSIGFLALILSLGLIMLYLPGSPAALIWPYEWAIILGWCCLGVVLLGISKTSMQKVKTRL